MSEVKMQESTLQEDKEKKETTEFIELLRALSRDEQNPDHYSNCLVLLESQGRKHYQNQKGIPGGNKGYFC